MRGIGGWVGTRGAHHDGEGAARRAMTEAMGHRAPVGWLDWSTDQQRSPGPVVADTSLNDLDSVREAWAAWSSDPAAFASRLEGAFAVAALDRRRGVLALIRDRMGERPLYYVVGPDGVAFASEIKALRRAGLIRDPSLRPEAIDAYLAFTYIPAPWTIYREVHKVAAAHCVVIDLQKVGCGAGDAVRSGPYWRLPERTGEAATPEEMLDRLAEATRRRLEHSGSTAIFLSGGLDSSVVAALTRRATGSPAPTFSIGFSEKGLDESAHARRVAELLGGEHRSVILESVRADLVERVVAQLDEPMADAATIPTYVLAREASSVARVVLTGDGADALLAGDHWFRRLRWLDRMEGIPSALLPLVPVIAGLGGAARRRRYADLVGSLAKSPPDRYLGVREKWTWIERRGIYEGSFAASVDPSKTWATYLGAPVVWRRGESVDAAVRLDTIHGLPEDLLMKADKMCAAHGVESRSPFMDHRFAEWSARLEIENLLKGGASKYLLKMAGLTLLPRDLVMRRKHGFRTPIGRWMKEDLRPLVDAAFDPDRIRRMGVLDAKSMAELRRRFEKEPAHPALDGKVWQVVALMTWYRLTLE